MVRNNNASLVKYLKYYWGIIQEPNKFLIYSPNLPDSLRHAEAGKRPSRPFREA